MSGITRKSVCAIAVLAAVCMVFTSVCLFSVDSDAEVIAPDTSPVKSIAHRGYSDVAPENTIPAFQLAYEKGFRYVETDIAVTSDGKFVLLHDDTIDRTSDGSGKISNMTLAEVREYDFGSWKSPEYAGTQIPTLEEFLDFCSSHNLCPYLELKDGSLTNKQIREIVNIVISKSLLDDTSFISFSSDYLKVIRDYKGSARLGYLGAVYTGTEVSVMLDLKTDDNEVFFDLSISSDKACTDCKEAGIPVEVWADDSVEFMKSMNDYITGVTSNSLRYCDVRSVITFNLNGCTSVNTVARVDIGGTYRTVIWADDGNLLGPVTCMMGTSAQSVDSGVINITDVTGDITITASSVKEIILDGSDLLNGYDSALDQTSYRTEVGGRYYYSVIDNNEATVYPAFDIILSPNSVYEFKIVTSKTVGTDYSYSLQFFNNDAKMKVDRAYISDASSISDFTVCSYDTSWFTSSGTLVITTGAADDKGDFTVTLSPSASLSQQNNVCGFRFLLADAAGTASVDPSDYSFTVTKTACSVSFVSNGGSSVSTQTVTVGTNAVKPADPSRTGYTFGGWYSDEKLSVSYDFSSAVNDDTVLYAKWTAIEYTIRYVSNGGSSVGDQKYTVENEVLLKIPSKDGYNFSGWYDNADLSGDRINSVPVGSTGDRTFYAKWTECSAEDNTVLIVGIVVAVIAVACIGFFVIRYIRSKP